MTLITPQLPTIAPILPIHRMACACGMGVVRLMGHRPTAALDAESAEVLGNIKALL